MHHDPKLPPYTDFCKCTVCGEYFNSEKPFSMHRQGKVGIGQVLPDTSRNAQKRHEYEQ